MSDAIPPGKIADAYAAILNKLHIDPAFSIECDAQAEELVARGIAADGLTDFRHLPFVTIDNVDSRDLDQALYVEAADTGFVVWYAIADAAFFITPHTPLYERALAQGTSFYLPGMSIPLLPPVLSEGLISLNEDQDRRAMIFEVKLDAEGTVWEFDIHRGIVRSRAKLAYEHVQDWYNGARHDYDDQPYTDSLRSLAKVGELRISLAQEREAIMFERFEPSISVNTDGDRFEIGRRIRNDVERYNEQISLLCNTEGARLMASLGHSPQLQSVFRVHLPPLSQRLHELRETLDGIVAAHGLDACWEWKNQSLADYLADLPQDDPFARLRIAVERQVRYANRSSDFSSTVGPHFALGVDHYARFTAPMREIVGIFTHKEALEVLGMASPSLPGEDEILRNRVIEAANRGNSTQRAMEKAVGLLVIKQVFDDDLAVPAQTRPVRSGTIVGVRPTRLYVLLDDIPIDVKVWTDDLNAITGQELKFSQGVLGTQAPFLFRVGDEIRLRTSHFDAGRQRVVLRPVFEET